MPYANGTASLDYTDPTIVISDLGSFYYTYNGGTNIAYSEKELESSPLNRVLKQGAPGDWALTSGKEIKFAYQTNAANEVQLFKVTTTWDSASGCFTPVISSPQPYYPANTLYKTITKDENWTSGKNNTTEEFKNKEGQVVLKRTYSDVYENGVLVEAEAKHDTYYVYDVRGNLTFVMPPLTEGDSDQNILDNLGYQYKYDYRNRLVEKKLPGKQWEYIVYDNLDRPVATGPAYHYYGTGAIGWMVTEYDVLGRVTQTGWKQLSVSTTDRASFQNNVTSGSNPFTLSANDILTKSYYDDYTYSGAPNPLPTQIEGKDLATIVKGLPTGAWTKVLDVNNPNAGETSYTLYDEYYRPVRTYTSNHLGGFTQVDSKLDWAGKTAYSITTHKYDTNGNVVTVRDNFFYTAQDRLELHTQQINGGSAQLIAKNTYDELGQLTSKNVGGTDATGNSGLQTVDYTYNIRGWLKGINDVSNLGTDLFAFRINYNTLDNLGDFDTQGTPLYNGNIAATYWKSSSDNVLRKYNYNYDELNRLLEANYLKPQNASTPDNYLEKLSYDKNGNIQTLLRNGNLDTDGAQAVNLIDDLVYTYDKNNKNLLKKVMDQSVSPQGFNESLDTNSNGTYDTKDDYDYDVNGNLIKDENKGITEIKYNHLNLPVAISFGSNKIEYIYNAVGQKVVKTVSENSVITKTEYLSGFQYKGSMLQFFPHAEGYVNVVDNHGVNSYNYVFNYTDHLGNIRLSYGVDPDTQSIKILEENHYYAFGLKHTNYNSDKLLYQKGTSGGVVLKGELPTIEAFYKYKFQGQELQDELQLFWYAFKWRNYNPEIARFMSIDPLTEEYEDYTPYQFASNQPVHAQEVEGLENAHDLNKKVQLKETRTIVRDNIPQTDIRLLSIVRSVAVEGAYTGIRSAGVRNEYKAEVSKLDVSDSKGRTEAKVNAREKTPAVVRTLIESERPTSVELKKTSGTANKTNAGANAKAELFGTGGKVLLFTGVAASTYNVATSDDKPKAVALEGGAWTGAVAGGELLGTALAPAGPYVAAGGAILGSIIGGIAGEKAVQKMLENDNISSFRAEPGLNGCFLEDTKILMADNTEKFIKDVEIGDYVMSYNFDLSKVEAKKVLKKVSPVHEKIVEITFSGEIINSNTLDHPYYVIGKGWASFDPKKTFENYNMKVDKLETGDFCYFLKGKELIIVKIVSFKIIEGTFITINLSEIQDNHNFFANGILVHNKQ